MVNESKSSLPCCGDIVNIPGCGGALTVTVTVATDVSPPSPVHDNLNDRVDPMDKVFEAIRSVTVLKPALRFCVTGLNAAVFMFTEVSLRDHVIAAADKMCTEPVIVRGRPKLIFVGNVDRIETRGLSAVWTMTVTAAVTDLVASDTTTVITEVVAAEASFAMRTNFEDVVVVGRRRPHVLETVGAVCMHDQLKDSPAAVPATPLLSIS